MTLCAPRCVLHHMLMTSLRRALIISTYQYRDGLVSFNTVIMTLTSDARQQDLLTGGTEAKMECRSCQSNTLSSIGKPTVVKCKADDASICHDGERSRSGCMLGEGGKCPAFVTEM